MANESMPCPLCAATLTAEQHRDRNGRYHCPACSPTSAESRYGWLFRPPIVSQRAALAEKRGVPVPAMANDPMFGARADGTPITRTRTCECGRVFEQRQLSGSFLTIVERHSAGAIDAVTRQIPEYFVPVHCPRCERIDMHRWAQIARARETTRDDQPELTHAAD